MTEFSDYQCPACKQFELVTLPQILTTYVDTGKVKIVFKDYPFLGPNSAVDAEYGRAVWALYPAQFAAWRTAIYSQDPVENTLNAADNLTFLRTVLTSISGVDADKVIAAVAANKTAYDASVATDKAEAATVGVNATPSFIIGSTLVTGSYPYATYQAVIDPLLK